MGAPPWPAKDLEYLRANYDILGPKQIAIDLGKSHSAVYTMGNRLGLKSRFQLGVESVRHDYFAKVSRPVQAYLLGLLAADGCVGDDDGVSISLADKDRGLVELARDEIAPLGRVTAVTTKTGPAAGFNVTSKRLAADLAAYGVTPRKTFTLQWPERLPPELEGSYICGAFDGDGHLGWLKDRRYEVSYPRWELISASPGYLEAVAASIRRNTGATVIEPFRRNGRTVWQITANSSNALAVDRWIHADVPGLARKRIPDGVVIRALPRVYDRPPRPGKAKGAANGNAKLTEQVVADARRRFAAGEDIRSLAREHDVTGLAMRNAVTGKTWKHVAA